jgi:hypothetical protein
MGNYGCYCNDYLRISPSRWYLPDDGISLINMKEKILPPYDITASLLASERERGQDPR